MISRQRCPEGIEVEVFYKGDFVISNQPAGDYDRHRLGVSLNIVF